MIVTDASVWVSFLVTQDTHHPATHKWLTSSLAGKTPLVAPILLLAEVGGALSRRLGDPDLGARAVGKLLSIPTLRLVSMDHDLGMETAEIASRYRLRGADACYVAVAARLKLPLVTWDREHVSRVTGLVAAYTPAEAGTG